MQSKPCHGQVRIQAHELVIGWLEILVILYKIIPNMRARREIYDILDKPWVGSFYHYELGIEIDKANGIISANGTNYKFTPVHSLTADM
jgi:hypothetical protein